ncbi:MAG: DUF2384 domain-containing protein [Rhodoferax sp.]|nr:DUF2384 domain-containing protein [Rhodoferax sp.]
MTAASESIARRKPPPKTGTLRGALPGTATGAQFIAMHRAGKAQGKQLAVRDLSGIERHELVKGGLSTHFFMEALQAYSVVSESELLHAIGLSTKTLGRREESRLGPRHSDAALALLEVTEIAERVLGTRKLAEQWLKEPAIALDGRLPLDLISTAPGIETVKDLLTRMEYGVYA